MFRSLLAATAVIAIAAPVSARPLKHRSTTGMTAVLPASNPFSKPSALPFQAPDFGQIKDSDYFPAMLAGMAQQKAEVIAIANQKAAPTFDNTLGAMERSGQLLERTQLAFSAEQSANTNDALDAVDTKTSPLLSAHRDFIFLNPKLFARVKSLHTRQAGLGLDAEQAKLLQVVYNQFVHSGAQLSPAKQAELKKLNLRIGTLQTAFGQKLLAATKAAALIAGASAQDPIAAHSLAGSSIEELMNLQAQTQFLPLNHFLQ